MRKMRTAEEMVNYCLEKGTSFKWKKKHLELFFSIIEDALNEDEYAVLCFVAKRHVTAYVTCLLYTSRCV